MAEFILITELFDSRRNGVFSLFRMRDLQLAGVVGINTERILLDSVGSITDTEGSRSTDTEDDVSALVVLVDRKLFGLIGIKPSRTRYPERITVTRNVMAYLKCLNLVPFELKYLSLLFYLKKLQLKRKLCFQGYHEPAS